MLDSEVRAMAIDFYKGYGNGKDGIKSSILNWVFDADEAQIDRVLADMDIPKTSDDVWNEHLKQKKHLATMDEKIDSILEDQKNYLKTHVYGISTKKEQTVIT